MHGFVNVKNVQVEGCQIESVGRMRENGFRMQTSAGKAMDNVYRDTEGILSVEFLKRGT